MTVSGGVLQGNVHLDRREFLNIPFASPPVGELRFRPPRPAIGWSGTRDAKRAGNVCAQPLPLGTVSEDCLVLNVYTPRGPQTRDLPVMVWFHGGGYTMGSAVGYDPTPLVTQGEVVVVTVNYRMGPFGFLAAPGLAAESGTTGNYGILDQQAGLRWVRDNVRAFGGDPGNVTIFGESAGGHSVCMQLISPSAAGLFHKAITQSGGCIDTDLGPATAADAYERSQRLATGLGCADPATAVTCLRGKTADEVLQASGGTSWAGLSWVPVVDGVTVPEPLDQAVAADRYNRVPVLVGTNLNEGALFVALRFHLASLRPGTRAELTEEIRRLAGEAAPELLAAYPAASDTNADVALTAAITDGSFACPGLASAAALATRPGQAVYHYEFADPNPPLSDLDPFMPLGDYHAAEMFYLFSTVQNIPVLLNDNQRRLSAQMIGYWTTFARTGVPSAAGAPAWPRFATSNPTTQRLTSAGTAPFTTFGANHHCSLWGVR